jgi:hypothetical protein
MALPTDDEWRRMVSTTVALAKIQPIRAKPRTALSFQLATRDSMLYSPAAVPMMGNMHDSRLTDSTGQRRRSMGALHGATTSAAVGKLCIVKRVARSTEPFPFGVSGIEYCNRGGGRLYGFCLHLPSDSGVFYKCGRPRRSLSIEPVAGSHVVCLRRSG